jgi:hypothetical protein
MSEQKHFDIAKQENKLLSDMELKNKRNKNNPKDNKTTMIFGSCLSQKNIKRRK